MGHGYILNTLQAGQEAFKSITRSYYKGAICAIVVYDVTSQNSYNHVKDWIDEI